ncbi:methyltransferase family protein [Couchioplanes caeruleus]|uniref:Methyltransferase family protein n=1 Tax=Couchioplanes caeruleus TaxID=56438 RepID=A0A3N1GBW0_9ACTN|nr:methyltransferase family protein [Couchioplanes caeruleus]
MVARTEEHWAAYNDDQHDRQPRPLCEELVALAGHGEGRPALDIGCGAGVETSTLLRAGWRVHAIDSAPGTPERVWRTVGDRDGLTIEVNDLSTLGELPAVDLVYAGYSLPYLAPRDFPRIWAMIRKSLRPGAWLAVNLFGERDSWASNPSETFLTEAAARSLFDGLHIVRFVEEDAPGESYSGLKHWHVFDVIARLQP